MKPYVKHYLIGLVTIAVGVAGGLWLNELRNKAKTVPPVTSTAKV